jgi:HEAT repeat protein
MADLRATTARLRQLGTKRPTPATRAEVVAELASKWEGVQAVAVEVLGGWGDRQCVDCLRQFLVRCFDREAGWGIRGVAVRALRRVVTQADVDWVLDLYFRLSGWLPKHELLWLVAALPPQAARERLVAALRDPRWDNRHAAVKAIGNMDFPDLRQLLLPLWNDPDDDVRGSVRLLTPVM